MSVHTDSAAMFDVGWVRDQFPILAAGALADPVHYLDNAATSHKPRCVLEALDDCYRRHYGPVHRGLYGLAEDASVRYEAARATMARFIGAEAADHVIFTRSATEAINMVAAGWLGPRLQSGDSVWVTRLEHHANFLPWQRVCERAGAHLRIMEVRADGSLELPAAEDLYGPRTKLIAMTRMSNVLGLVPEVDEIVASAHARGIPVLIDGAQGVGHMYTDVVTQDYDFFAFSAHKMGGPTGIGVLYAKPQWLMEMEPLLLGGGMVDWVGDDSSQWSSYPAKLEAGSPHLAGAVGFAAAADFLSQVGLPAIRQHIDALTSRALEALADVPEVAIYGSLDPMRHAGIIAFNLTDVHPHDLAHTLAQYHVAIRAGHHCCQPLMRSLGVPATARLSFALYNELGDVDHCVEAIRAAHRAFA
ncbi:MAG: aminotransferase class V-fold PLP-dependent enzyme [Acidiferrobacter sp.]